MKYKDIFDMLAILRKSDPSILVKARIADAFYEYMGDRDDIEEICETALKVWCKMPDDVDMSTWANVLADALGDGDFEKPDYDALYSTYKDALYM